MLGASASHLQQVLLADVDYTAWANGVCYMPAPRSQQKNSTAASVLHTAVFCSPSGMSTTPSVCGRED